MPTISVPNTFSAGSSLASNAVNKNVYDPNPADSTLEVLNGGLTDANFTLDASVKLPYRVIRPASRVYASSGTTPIDLFRLISPPTKSEANSYQALAGGAIRFFVPRDDTRVILTAHLTVGCDHDTATSAIAGSVCMRLNETRITHTTRNLPASQTGAVSASHYKDRVFTFQHTVELDKGWHTADVAAWVDCLLIRCRSRAICAILMP